MLPPWQQIAIHLRLKRSCQRSLRNLALKFLTPTKIESSKVQFFWRQLLKFCSFTFPIEKNRPTFLFPKESYDFGIDHGPFLHVSVKEFLWGYPSVLASMGRVQQLGCGAVQTVMNDIFKTSYECLFKKFLRTSLLKSCKLLFNC
jgi:hypothetical protein